MVYGEQQLLQDQDRCCQLRCRAVMCSSHAAGQGCNGGGLELCRVVQAKKDKCKRAEDEDEDNSQWH